MLLGTVLLVAALGAPVLHQSGSLCPDVGTWTATCYIKSDGSQVDVGASTTQPGQTDTPPSSSGGSRPQNGPGQAPDATPAPPPAAECALGRCDIPYEVAMLPDVTIEDLASFRPAGPTLAGEPTGFGVVGMPTNLVAAASEQRIAGTLFDYAVVVRFVPSAYVFEFGDGTSLRSASGGATWERLGQAQFTPTSTSHVYRERGSYTVRVRVQYSASVDFGTGRWRPVPGFVSASGDPYDVRVVTVQTALVERTCVGDPTGPGC